MSLIVHYPLNGDALDYSGNGYHLTNIGSSSLAGSGKIGQCLSLTGNAAQYLYYSNFPIYKYKFSWSVWAYCNGTNPAGFAYIVSQGRDNTVSGINIATNQAGDNILIFIGNYGIITIPISCISVWRHIVVTGDGNNIKVYVDGVLQSTIAQPSDINFTYATNNALVIGKMTYSYTGATYYFPFNGKINDVRIYDHALSEKEIKEIAKAKILHYTFDDFQEPTTNLIPAIVGATYSNWGTNTGTSTLFTSPSGRNGVYLNITSFTDGGVNWYYAGGQFNASASTEYTVSAVIKYSGTTPSANLFYIRQYDSVGTQLTEYGVYNSSYQVDLKNGWYKAYATFTTHASCAKLYVHGYQYSTGSIWIYDLQIEKKSYYTEFILPLSSRGGIVNDQSGFRNNATLALATTPQWVSDSKIGSSAYKFYDKYLTKTIYTPEHCTINLWYKSTDSTTPQSPFTINSTAFEISVGSGRLWVGYEIDSVRQAGFTGPTTLFDGNWHMLSSTFDGINIRTYVDGVKIDTWNYPGSLTRGNCTLYVGSMGGSYFVHGYLDDVRMYSTALSDSDILELYQTRASIDNNGNLYSGELYENLLNRCPPFEKWTLSGGATVSNGILTIPNQSASAVSPYIYMGPDSNWSFRGEYFSTGTSIQFSPASGFLQNSSYFDGSFQLTVNTANHTGNGNAQAFPINTWTIKKWSYLGGNLVRYIKISISGNGTYTSSTGYQIRNPMLTSINYDGPYTPYSDRLLPNTEIIKTTVDKNSIIRTNLFSEVGITDGLIAYYPFDKDANDYSGSNLNGTVSGAVLTNGVKGQGYSFDGVDDYIRLSSDITTGNSDWSVTAWVKTTSTGKNTILSNYNGGPVYNAICTNNGKIAYNHYNNAWLTEYGNINIADGVWHFLCWCNTGLTKKIDLYVDGVKDATVNSQISTGTGPVNNIGRDWGTATANAILDEIRIYNRTLSIEEVAILYETTSPTSSSVKITKDTIYMRNEIKEVY